MTEIPEHLLKRAQAAREKAAADAGAGASTEGEATSDSRIPAHLLERSKAAKAGGSVAVAEKPSGAVVTAPAEGNVPMAAGPGGHTQRLLTVVKSGSIQDVKSEPVDKVHTWPHLLAVEFIMFKFCVFSWVVNAPLLQAANFNQTPNPSKAPWYFLGLQELLTMFHPMIAGVTLPTVGLVALMFSPYLDKTVSNKPEDRKFMTSMFTIFLMFWAVLVIVSSFFRGPGYNFTFPWRDGIFFEL